MLLALLLLAGCSGCCTSSRRVVAATMTERILYIYFLGSIVLRKCIDLVYLIKDLKFLLVYKKIIFMLCNNYH